MPRTRTLKTSFTAGEVSSRLLGRGDLRAFDNGALRLRNVVIQPTGGVTRRAGLAHVDGARGPGRLVAFEFNTEQTYLLAFSAGHVDIYRDDARLARLAAPWTADQLAHITWTQSADTLLVCHPDVPPRRLTRTGAEDWRLSDWPFHREGAVIHQPFYRFGDPEVTLTPSGTAGAIEIAASAPVFRAGHNGQRFRLHGRQVQVTHVLAPTRALATVIEDLPGTGTTRVWDEASFSPARGWPVSAAFHQDRLVIGGSRDLPNRLWLSRSADLWNFDLGTGQDDEAIEFAILSDQINAIRAVFSGRHLQVFTSGAEWMVTGDPLTPQNIQIHRQTRVGSPVDRAVPPRDVDGATLFVSRNGREIREFLYADTEQAYRAIDLSLLAGHLIDRPLDQDFDARRRLLLVVMGNGTLAALTVYRAEQVIAWTRLETAGAIRAVAVVGEAVYVLVERAGRWSIERFEDGLDLDAALEGESDPPTAVWSGLDHLEGHRVRVVADGAPVAPRTVVDGTITIDAPAHRIAAGSALPTASSPCRPTRSPPAPMGPRCGWWRRCSWWRRPVRCTSISAAARRRCRCIATAIRPLAQRRRRRSAARCACARSAGRAIRPGRCGASCRRCRCPSLCCP